MAQRSKDTFQKREREKEKQQKQKFKQERRLEARKSRTERQPGDGLEDPDIAGIKPGPQPLPDEWS